MALASGDKRRRSKTAAGPDNSLIADFLELRESSMVQTGPKRPRRGGGGGGELWLTPDPLTPLENIQHRQRRRSQTASGKPTPASKTRSLTAESSSIKRASSGGRKSAKKSTKPKSPEQSSTSDESPSAKQLTSVSMLTPLGHLQIDDQRQDRQSTRSQERKLANSEPQEVSSSTSASGSTTSTSDESPGQTAGYAVSGITPLEQLHRKKKKKRESKRSSVQGTRRSMRKSTMKLRSSGVRGVMWLPHLEHTTSSLAPVSLGDSVSAPQDHAPPSHTPPASSTSAVDEGNQSDPSPLIQSEESSSQVEKHPSPSQIGEDEMPATTEEPKISSETMEHGASSPLADEFQPSPLTGGHEISPLVTAGAGAPSSSSSSSSNRYSSGSSAGSKQLKSVLKTDTEGRRSSLKRRTRRNSRVSFGRFVTVAEYNPHHQHPSSTRSSSRRNNSRNLTMQSFADENLSSMERERASLSDGLQGLGERDEGGRDNGGLEELGRRRRGGGDSEEEDGDDGVIESAESSSSPPPGELEPLGDEGEGEEMGGSGSGDEGDLEGEESMDEMEVEEPLEELEQKRMSRHKRSTVVPKALVKKKQSKGKARANTLPRALIKNFFMLFSKRRMTKDAMNLISKFTEAYLKQASNDIAAYVAHAGRKTIEIEDIVLLMKRQRFISEDRPFEFLVNDYLPLEHAEQLLPCAVAGKDIIPQIR